MSAISISRRSRRSAPGSTAWSINPAMCRWIGIPRRKPPNELAVSSQFLDVPAGKIAAVVTSLEMRARVAQRPQRSDGNLTLQQTEKPDLAWFRKLYRLVGADWIWFSRLEMSDDALAAIIHDP